mgnify:CR=1 FL=1
MARITVEDALHHIPNRFDLTLTEPRGIEFVRRLGVERVILARELSIAEIARIRSETPVPLDVRHCKGRGLIFSTVRGGPGWQSHPTRFLKWAISLAEAGRRGPMVPVNLTAGGWEK